MRSGRRLWMVTLKDREPSPYEELPVYFKTRTAADDWATWLNQNRNTDAWSWREDDVMVARHAPDDVRYDDVDGTPTCETRSQSPLPSILALPLPA